MSNFPEDLKYSAEHVWVRAGNANTVRVGITDAAAEDLGDIVNVSLPTVGQEVAAEDVCVELDSTKLSMAEVFSPVSGVIVAVNENLDESPEIVNADPYGDGWLFEVELSDQEEVEDLLDADEYATTIDELDA